MKYKKDTDVIYFYSKQKWALLMLETINEFLNIKQYADLQTKYSSENQMVAPALSTRPVLKDFTKVLSVDHIVLPSHIKLPRCDISKRR